MSFALPPIVKLAESLLLDIERAAARFSRSHRYHARHPWLAPLTTIPRRFDHRIEGRRVNVRIHHP